MGYLLIVLGILIIVVVLVQLFRSGSKEDNVSFTEVKKEETKEVKEEVKKVEVKNKEVKAETKKEENNSNVILDEVNKGFALTYKAKKVETLKEINEEDYGFKIPKGQVLKAQLIGPFQLARAKDSDIKIAAKKVIKDETLEGNFATARLSAKKKEELKLVDKGSLFITDKTIIHTGSEKVSKIPLAQISKIGLNDDLLVIKKETGAPFVINTNKELSILLNNLINKLR